MTSVVFRGGGGSACSPLREIGLKTNMPRITSRNHVFANALGSATSGTTATVGEYRHKSVSVTAAVNSSLTFKFQTSNGASVSSDTAPDFSSPQTATNMWEYASFYDMQAYGTVIGGDTGVALNNDTVANNTHRYLILDETAKYLNVVVTAFTDGSLTAVGSFAND